MSRRTRILLAAGVAVALVVAGIAAFVLTRGGDVSNPDVEFRAEPTEEPAPEAPKRASEADKFVWPIYGLTKDRRRYLPASSSLRPPFHRIWTRPGKILLEFTPVLAGPRLYLLKNNGALYAISKRTGRVIWKRKLGYLAAASPALSKGRVFSVLLQRGKGIRAGRISAHRTRDGKELWSRPLASRSESSPLVDGDRLYFGSENGTVYSIRTSDGAVRWKFKARGAVKGGLALADGKLYFGDYSGRMYAIRQRDGRPVWTTGTSGARFGLSAGNFYATPAVAFGRVYIGNTDGKVYSFASSDGRLAWTRSTGGYVYGSPAVATVPGGRPTVYVGSYGGTFYALDARSGRVRWSYRVGGKISGGATVIGDIVYFADLTRKRTLGLGARTGRKVFEFGRGSFHPVISDGRTIFLTGYSTQYAFRPLSAAGRESIERRERSERRQRSQARRAARSRDARLQSRCMRAAERTHDRRAAIRRSFRRCVRRERAERRRAACRRRAAAVHDRRSARLRSMRRCVRRGR